MWTCPPDRNERRNRSPTIFIFEGSDGEGTDARPLWGPRARFWAGRADGPSQRSTPPLAPSKTKVAAERCRSGAEVWTCPPDWDERRNRSPTIFIFEGSDGEGTDAHPLWGARARFWAGRADGPSQGSTHPLAPSKTKVAAEHCRSGAEVWTCPPDRDERRNRSPTIFIFEETSGRVGREKGNARGNERLTRSGEATGNPSQGVRRAMRPLCPGRCTRAPGQRSDRPFSVPQNRSPGRATESLERPMRPTIFIFEADSDTRAVESQRSALRLQFSRERPEESRGVRRAMRPLCPGRCTRAPGQRSDRPFSVTSPPSKTEVAAECCRHLPR